MSGTKSSRIARNRSATATPIGTLGAIGLSFFANAASAEVVVHDNRDGTFKWERTIKFVAGDPVYGTFLDIRQPPTQSGERLPGTLGSWFRFNNSSSEPGLYTIEWDSNLLAISNSKTSKTYTWKGNTVSTMPVREYLSNDFVGLDEWWVPSAMHYWSLPFNFGFEGGTPLISDLAYLGIRIQTGANTFNYGWVLFENWTNPLMWAYETTPNTPIQIPIPSPGVVGFLAVASSIACSRRRRSIASC